VLIENLTQGTSYTLSDIYLSGTNGNSGTTATWAIGNIGGGGASFDSNFTTTTMGSCGVTTTANTTVDLDGGLDTKPAVVYNIWATEGYNQGQVTNTTQLSASEFQVNYIYGNWFNGTCDPTKTNCNPAGYE